MSPRSRAAVLGSPVAHSLSPVLHRAAYAHLGLDWRYDAYDVDAAGLAGFMDRLGQEWRGLSLTMPLKQAVLGLLDQVSETARLVGAANTVLLPAGGRRVGDNTDVSGVEAALAAIGVTHARRALVLGGGATTRSATVALARLGVREVVYAVRDPGRSAEALGLAGRLGLRVETVPLHGADADERIAAVGADVTVSTVPAVAAAAVADPVVGAGGAVLDVVYDPWPTPLSATARGAGLPVASGLDLLVHQAVDQIALMTGLPPVDPQLLYAAGLSALGAG